MKISPPVEVVADAVNRWARDVGWKPVGIGVATQYRNEGGRKLLPDPDTQYGLVNAPQRVKRIFQGYDGPKYNRMAEELAGSALRAMPVMCSSAVTRGNDPVYLAAKCLKEFTEFLNAVNLGAGIRELTKEGVEARDAFVELFNSVIPEAEY